VNDERFISILNDVSGECGLCMPALSPGDSPSSEFLSDWARFLESCVKKGVELSDPRWQRVTIDTNTPHSHFTLDEAATDPSSDEDFRVGLQLLVGLLEPADGNDG